jgi:hypothetical protein
MRYAVPVLLLATGSAVAQTAQFAAPVRLKAGDKFLGKGRLFPSPVYHDLDGDKRLDIVVGDLVGRLTVANRASGDVVAFAGEQKVLGADGEEVDLQNW